MPKVRCPCDHVIWLGEIPCPHEWLIISDTRYSSFYKADDPVKVDIEELYKATLRMVRTFSNTILVNRSVNRRRRHIVERKGEDEYVVTSDITIHGAARPVTSPLKAVDPFPIRILIRA